MSQTSRWWRPRFCLASLLWLTTGVAISIGMYRHGYRRGQEDAVNNRTLVANMVGHYYFVSKIVPKKSVGGKLVNDFDTLMSDLRREVLPYTWKEKGGPAWMGADPASNALQICHDDDGHERIGQWIRKRREESAKAASENVAAAEAAKTIDR
jgi:hypothetical protein